MQLFCWHWLMQQRESMLLLVLLFLGVDANHCRCLQMMRRIEKQETMCLPVCQKDFVDTILSFSLAFRRSA